MKTVNVGNVERILCAAVAGWILVGILRGKRSPLTSLPLLGTLTYRAVSGNCLGYSALGVSTCSTR